MKSKDITMYEELFREYADNVYRYIYVRTRDAEKSKDIVAETFKRLLEKKDLKPELAKHWLFTVARNTMYKMFKDEGKSGKQVLDEMIEESEIAAADSGDYDKDLIDEELLKNIENYLDKISPKSREVISLKIWEEMSFPEIADILSEKESTVKLRYYRGLEKLEELIGKDYKKHQITVPLVIGGFALLGVQPAYAAPANFVANFISTTIHTMDAATATAAAAQTGAAAAKQTGFAAFIASLQGTKGAILAAVGTTVVIGGAAGLAIASGTFTNPNAASPNPNSYPNSYATSYPTSYSNENPTPIVEVDPELNEQVFRSKDYGLYYEPFVATLPGDWKIEEETSKGPYGQVSDYSITMSKGNDRIIVQQFDTGWEGTPPCYLESSNLEGLGTNTMSYVYFVNAKTFKLDNHDYTIAYTDYKDAQIFVYNYETDKYERRITNGGVGINFVQNTALCGSFPGTSYGSSYLPFGGVLIQSSIEGDLSAEMKSVLSSFTAQDGELNQLGTQYEQVTDPKNGYSTIEGDRVYVTNELPTSNPHEQLAIELLPGWYAYESLSNGGKNNSVFIEKSSDGLRINIYQNEKPRDNKCYFNLETEVTPSDNYRNFLIKQHETVKNVYHIGFGYKIAQNQNVDEYTENNGSYSWNKLFTIAGKTSTDYVCTNFADHNSDWTTDSGFGSIAIQEGDSTTAQEREESRKILKYLRAADKFYDESHN